MKTCGEVMTKNPTCCTVNETADRAAILMKKEDVGAIPVVDNQQSKKLVGIVTDRDLTLNVLAEGRDARNVKLESVMTRVPFTCREGDDLNEAMEAMAKHQVRRMPVVNDNGQIVGIIAQADLATRVDKPKKTAAVIEEISEPKK